MWAAGEEFGVLVVSDPDDRCRGRGGGMDRDGVGQEGQPLPPPAGDGGVDRAAVPGTEDGACVS